MHCGIAGDGFVKSSKHGSVPPSYSGLPGHLIFCERPESPPDPTVASKPSHQRLLWRLEKFFFCRMPERSPVHNLGQQPKAVSYLDRGCQCLILDPKLTLPEV